MALPRRLIFCVDGTYCREDGNTLTGNQTNVWRTWASVKKGPCRDDKTGTTYYQDPVYVTGLGTADELDFWKKLRAGAFGEGYSEQIRQGYERCCQLGENDEVWLYGFSRGAFVVRAIAGLLHYIGAIKSKGPEFKKHYASALNIYRSIRKGYKEKGEIYHYLRENTAPGPRIQFVGVYDTVKALKDNNLHDISFNDGTKHLRHALALHEDRAEMDPEGIFPNFGEPVKALGERTFVQAWFVGAHMDVGGSKRHDGLSLYPLQWMLDESRQCGLVLAFDELGKRIPRLDNPLAVVFPESKDAGHIFKTQNGIRVGMYDIRATHDSSRYYSIKLNKQRSVLWKTQARRVFVEDGTLMGYHPSVPQGTIIHPSVYFLLFNHALTLVPLNADESELQQRIVQNERTMLGMVDQLSINHGFWASGDMTNYDMLQGEWPIRVLVCGNAGVGKSTLINRVFGVPVAEPSSRVSGVHDITKECKWEGRPDLIVHDSCGFESASTEEMTKVENFLRDMSSANEPRNRLHVIWFCVRAQEDRTMQESTAALFRAIGQHAGNVPVIVVATQKDVLLDSKYGIESRKRRKAGAILTEQLDMECQTYAAEELGKRVELIEEEMRQVMGEQPCQLELCVPVSEDDDESIKLLTKETIACIDNDVVRLTCIAAQVVDIDAKVNAALAQVMKLYKRILISASTVSFIPGGPTTERTSAAIACCSAIINCFISRQIIDMNTAYEILKTNVWDDLGNNVMVAFAEAIAVLGVVGSFASFGSPLFLAASAINIPLVVPATTRLFLILGCDLILILVRCFEEAIYTKIGMPGPKQLQEHARKYRWSGMSAEVHARVKELVPRSNLIKSYRTDKVGRGIEKIVADYKKLIEDELNPQSMSASIEKQFALKIELDSIGESTLHEDNEDLWEDIKDIRQGMILFRLSNALARYRDLGILCLTELKVFLIKCFKPDNEKNCRSRAEVEFMSVRPGAAL